VREWLHGQMYCKNYSVKIINFPSIGFCVFAPLVTSSNSFLPYLCLEFFSGKTNSKEKLWVYHTLKTIILSDSVDLKMTKNEEKKMRRFSTR
jgi:hypothetical protein